MKVLWDDVEGSEGTYGFLSTFAHPRVRELEVTWNMSGTLLTVPEYDETRFALAVDCLLQGALVMLEFVERLADYLVTPSSQEVEDAEARES